MKTQELLQEMGKKLEELQAFLEEMMTENCL
jgi:hypothetical protein